MTEHREPLPPRSSLMSAMGGEPVLRAVINRFVDRMFTDLMIGFFFRDADRARVKEKEYELAAQLLGASVRYTGRPLKEVHGPHRIMGGQFARRSQILREVLAEFEVPEPVVTAWFEHIEALRDQITSNSGSACQ